MNDKLYEILNENLIGKIDLKAIDQIKLLFKKQLLDFMISIEGEDKYVFDPYPNNKWIEANTGIVVTRSEIIENFLKDE